MRGKYSPTVSAAYRKSQNWHDTYSKGSHYDPEGYDSYGYNADDVDRAGHEESDYYESYYDEESDYCEPHRDTVWDEVLSDWGFDGEKPVRG